MKDSAEGCEALFSVIKYLGYWGFCVFAEKLRLKMVGLTHYCKNSLRHMKSLFIYRPDLSNYLKRPAKFMNPGRA